MHKQYVESFYVLLKSHQWNHRVCIFLEPTLFPSVCYWGSFPSSPFLLDIHVLSQFWWLNKAAWPPAVLCVDMESCQKVRFKFYSITANYYSDFY